MVLYADQTTPSMRDAMAETDRRRAKQVAYNEVHGITPTTIVKAIDSPLAAILDADYLNVPKDDDDVQRLPELVLESVPLTVQRLRAEMKQAAAQLDF